MTKHDANNREDQGNADGRRRKVVMALKKLRDLKRFPDEWGKLRELSDNTTIDGIGADPVGVEVRGDKFTGVMAVHLVLEFDEKPKPFSTSNTVVGNFDGHFAAGKPIIDRVTLDMRPFEVEVG